jgi:ABC-type glycerol-3-phosphate transport system substrate-binding protein
MPDNSKSQVQKSRRRILKMAGAAGAASLAGCSGSGDDGGSSGGDDGGDDGSSGDDGSGSTSGSNLSGVKIQFWDMQHTQSEGAAQLFKSAVEAVESRTGAKITPTWGSWSDDAGGKWKRNIASGNRPALLQGSQELHGQYVEEGWFKPLKDITGEYSQEVADAIQPTLDTYKSAWRGYDPAKVYELPIATEIGSPFLIRTDHFEEAGVNVESEFPPQSYDDIVDLGTTLQEDGPGQYGFQIYGATGDVTDEAPLTWSISKGGIEGSYLNEDWTDVVYDSDAWKKAMSEWVSMFQEHGLSSQNSASASDESATEFIMSGDASMAQISGPDHGMIANQAPELIENEQIKYAPHWSGGEAIGTWAQSSGVLTAGPNDDEKKWERKQQVAIKLQKELLSRKSQKTLAKSVGIPPTRTDMNDAVTGASHNLIESQLTMRDQVDNDMIAWAAHPDIPAIKWQTSGPIFQNAVRGELTAEEACNKAAKVLREETDLKGAIPVQGQ